MQTPQGSWKVQEPHHTHTQDSGPQGVVGLLCVVGFPPTLLWPLDLSSGYLGKGEELELFENSSSLLLIPPDNSQSKGVQSAILSQCCYRHNGHILPNTSTEHQNSKDQSINESVEVEQETSSGTWFSST